MSAATLALAWTWPRDVVMAECDPTGGQALAVFDPEGVHGRRGTFELLLAGRRMPLHHAMSAQMLTLPDGTGTHYLLPGASSIREADSLQWQALAGLFQAFETVDVLADCGRLRVQGTPRAVLEAADLTVLMVRNDRNSLRAAASSLDVVRDEISVIGHDGLVVVVANHDSSVDKGFRQSEVAREFGALGVPVVGALPWDPMTASRLTHVFTPDRKFENSPLICAARQLAVEIGRHAHERAGRLRKGNKSRCDQDVRPELRSSAIPQPRQLRLVPVGEPAPVPRRKPNKDLGEGPINVH